MPEEKAGGADFAGVGGAIERRAGESRGEVLRAERVLDAALGGGPVVVALGFTGAIVLASGARGGELAAREGGEPGGEGGQGRRDRVGADVRPEVDAALLGAAGNSDLEQKAEGLRVVRVVAGVGGEDPPRTVTLRPRVRVTSRG